MVHVAKDKLLGKFSFAAARHCGDDRAPIHVRCASRTALLLVRRSEPSPTQDKRMLVQPWRLSTAVRRPHRLFLAPSLTARFLGGGSGGAWAAAKGRG